MTKQASLPFFDDELEALQEAVRALGGPQVVGHLLRKDLLPDKAGQWLRDCLNRERREKLEFSQILLVFREAREVGAHGPWQWINEQLGYHAPEPMAMKDEIAELQRSYIQAVRDMASMAKRIEQLSGPSLVPGKAA